MPFCLLPSPSLGKVSVFCLFFKQTYFPDSMSSRMLGFGENRLYDESRHLVPSGKDSSNFVVSRANRRLELTERCLLFLVVRIPTPPVPENP